MGSRADPAGMTSAPGPPATEAQRRGGAEPEDNDRDPRGRPVSSLARSHSLFLPRDPYRGTEGCGTWDARNAIARPSGWKWRQTSRTGCADSSTAAIGTSSELSAYSRLRAAGQEVRARQAWVDWVGGDGYRGLNAGPFELRTQRADRTASERSMLTGEARSQIASGFVSLHSQYYGRGPTKSKVYADGDVVVVVLEETFTPAERTLIDRGQSDSIQRIRRDFQMVMANQFKALVEQATGREVRVVHQRDRPRERHRDRDVHPRRRAHRHGLL